ncbi:MAG: hypothetical protein ABEJ75_01710 [Candidatus Nanohaloarchaea archaeon]
MPVKDRLVSWYIKKILIPGQQEIDEPGFLTKEMKGAEFNRDVLLPESIFINIEEAADTENAKSSLYGVGKSFGYRLATISNLTQFDGENEKKFKRFADFFVKYIESTYSAGMEYEIDLGDKLFQLQAEDYVVCRESGSGQILGSGGIAGIWSYMMQDSSIEGAHTQCEGRGEESCKFVCAPEAYLENLGADAFSSEIDGEKVEPSNDYESYNRVRETTYAQNSLQDLLDVGFFDYQGGKISHKDDRHILCDTGLPYLLGEVMAANHDENMLFESAFSYGKSLAGREQDREPEQFITEYLSATGWGDTKIREKDGGYEVTAYLFPWTKFWEETSFPLYRGLVSGLLSGFKDREVRLENVEKDTKGRGFTVKVSE